MELKTNTPVYIDLMVSADCHMCDRVRMQLEHLSAKHPQIELNRLERHEMKGRVTRVPWITPSIWLNGKLIFLGSYDEKVFLKHLHKIHRG